MKQTVWVLGDQLNRNISSLANRTPDDCRVLFVESTSKIASKKWHAQRLHLVLSAMEHFAAELRDDGFEVDYRRATSLSDGLRAHVDEFDVDEVVAMEPMSYDGRAMLERHGVQLTRNNQFTCHYDDFAGWVADRKSFKMEDFYRWQRTRLDIFMDGSKPVGGKWNYDHDNRERPPKDGRSWPEFTAFDLDDLDLAVLDRLPSDVWGAAPTGWWPVTRVQALQRLDEFIARALDPFGPHEDAMLSGEWKLAHSTLSSSMNLGLLHPGEVVERVEQAFRQNGAAINSVEGFIRQVIGWREYVWCVYWLWMPEYRSKNGLGAAQPVPPAFASEAETAMACVSGTISHVHDYGYAHHIERLMVLGNLALTAGVDPQAMTGWMWASFVDGAEWVMLPNVVGMALHADGGMMATKPYASGGAYINKMSNYCKGCRFDPKKRVGPDACPYTTLYWDFLAHNEDVLSSNHRMGQQLFGMRRLSDLDDVREWAVEVRAKLFAGEL